MSYTPKPGSYAFQAIEHLRSLPPGTQVCTSDLAKLVGPIANERMRHYLIKCVESGVLRAQRIGGGRGAQAWWSLAEFEPIPLAIEEEDDGRDLLPRRTSFPSIQPRPGMLFPGVYA